MLSKITKSFNKTSMEDKSSTKAEEKPKEKYDLLHLPFFTELEEAKEVLIAGCGGGYDIYSGIPLYFAIKNMGKNVHLANLTFSNFAMVKDAPMLGNNCKEITPESKIDTRDEYFPEKYLSEWFRKELQQEVSGYNEIVKKHNIDTIILVDGGTDSLMRGDEASLGSPYEDVSSIAAVHQVNVPRKYLCCIGFGVDSYHGVSHYLFLENVSRLIKDGGYLGVFSVQKEMKEAQSYISACQYAFKRMQTSIVSGSIAAAIEGHYGDYKFTPRTGGSELWINPLMSLYWCFNLQHVAKNLLSLEAVKTSTNHRDLHDAIFNNPARKKLREPHDIPV